MLSKGQKVFLYLCGLLSFFIGIVAMIPFRTLPGVNLESGIISTELIVKQVVLFVVVILLSIYPNIKKYQQLKNARERSKAMNMMCYLPIACYLVGLLVFIAHTLSYPYFAGKVSPLGDSVTAVILVVILCYVFFVIYAYHKVHSIVMKLNFSGELLLDIAVFLMTACFVVMAWRVDASYYDVFRYADGFLGKADIALFVEYLIAVIIFIIFVRGWFRTLKVDETSIYVNPTDFTDGIEDIQRAEYNRAYNDILDDFEAYFDTVYQKDGTKQPVETKEVENKVPSDTVSNACSTDATCEEKVENTSEEAEEETIVVTPIEKKAHEEVAKVTPVEVPEFVPLEEETIEPVSEQAVSEEEAIDDSLVEKKKALEEKRANLQTRNSDMDRSVLTFEEEKQEKETQLAHHEEELKKNQEEYQKELDASVQEEIEKLEKETEDQKQKLEEEARKIQKTLEEENAQKQIAEQARLEKEKAEAEAKAQALAKAEAKAHAKNEIKPTYPQIVMYAKSLEGVEITVKANPKETQHKFYINKKLYLMTQDTSNDYRIVFQATQEQMLTYLLGHPGTITVAKSPKGSWLKLTNKGDVEEDFLKQVVKDSLNAFKLEQEKEAKLREQAKLEKARLKKEAKLQAKPKATNENGR
jgi:hypothetical protein